MSSAKRYLVRFVSLAAVIATIWLCVLPVSASEQITLLDWGWGKQDNVSSYATSCYLFDDPNDAFVSLSYSSVVTNMFGFNAVKGYTYTYEHTFQLRGDLTSISVASGNLLNTVGYKYSLYSDKSGDGFSLQEYAGTINTALVSITKIDNITYRLKVVYNPEASGLQEGDIYLFASVLKKVNHNDVAITVGNEILTCIKDLDGTAFEQSLVDAVASMREENNNYFTNALEVLDQIKANGDEANTKLDQMPGKIGDELDKHDEKVKSESNTDGEAKVGQAKDALSAILPVSSIKDAITPLITACAYTGTTSVWTLPAIKLPSISGVISETTLSEPINFDLASYVTQYVPPNILQLVQYLCTLGLIIFAIKEIISLIKEVFGSD